MELTIVGHRLGLGASRQRTYSILSLCLHLHAKIEVSRHIWVGSDWGLWISAVLVILVVIACRGGATRYLRLVKSFM